MELFFQKNFAYFGGANLEAVVREEKQLDVDEVTVKVERI